MLISFFPDWMRNPHKDDFFRFPVPLDKSFPAKRNKHVVREYFRQLLDEVLPENLFLEKAKLAETAYGRSFQPEEVSANGDAVKYKTTKMSLADLAYAVLGALCHRSLLIHGLSPLLGVKHTTRYHADPLVYDMMEPYRPLVDLMMADFMIGEDISMKAWCKSEQGVEHDRYSLKLMDAIDASASSLARSYAEKSAELFWVPQLS
jgi:CRISPR-associated protein Cas1